MKLPFNREQDRLFEMFEESAANIVEGARAFDALLEDWTDIDRKVARITEFEHQGDTITHRIVNHMHRYFFTPIDREDIALLAHTLDDIIDFIQAAADAMVLYRIKEPTTRAKELSKTIVASAIEVNRTLPNLRQRSHMKDMLISCQELNRLENEADHIYRQALGDLFSASRDMADIIKWREIYEHMESATDRCEDVANVLEGVALKNT